MNYENLKGLLTNDMVESAGGSNPNQGPSREQPFNRRQPNIGFVVEDSQTGARMR
jgi:hypothetical protein